MPLALALLALIVAVLVASPSGAQSLQDQLRALSPDSTETWLSLARSNSPAFRAAVESLLVAKDLKNPDHRSRCEAAAEAYRATTRDSVLFADIHFLSHAASAARKSWSEAVVLDRDGRAAKGMAAVPLLEKANGIYAKLPHLRREAVAWGSLGTAYRTAENLEQAESCYKRALLLRERLGDPLWIGNALNTLGLLKREQNDPDSALVYLAQALAVREKIGNPNDIARTLNFMGDVHRARQELPRARELYERALATLGPQAAGETVINSREGLGNVLSNQGDHEAALDAYHEVLTEWEKLGRGLGVANTRGNLANELRSLGRPGEALQELNQARQFFEDEGLDRQLAETLNKACLVQLDLGNLDEALALAEEGLRRAEAAGYEAERARLLMNLGIIQSELGASGSALEHVERAASLADSLGDPSLQRDALFIAGSLYADRKDHGQALKSYEKALALDRRSGNQSNIAGDLGNIGMNKVALGRQDGMNELRQSVALAESLKAHSILWLGMLNLADAYEVFGELDSARAVNERTIQVMESVRIGDLGEEDKADFLEQRAFVYEAQTNVLGKLVPQNPGEGYELEAWEVAEQGKARALMDLLEEGSGRSVSANRSWKDVGQGVDLATLRKAALATDKDLILEYALGDSGSYLWAITRKDMTLHRLPDKKKIQDASRLLRRSLEEDAVRIRGRAPIPSEKPALSWRDQAAALGGMLLAPVAGSIQKASRIAVIPDGALHYIPFELLLQGSENTYMLAGKTVRYAPSAGVLAHLAGMKRHAGLPEAFLGVGDPVFDGSAAETTETLIQGTFRSGIPGTGETRLASLPNTRREVVAIGRLFDNEKPTMLLGEEARESSLSDPGYLSRFRILHFATHGLTDERFPKRCCLALSAADTSSDGFLRAEEIYALPVKADLVVLSACETGKGKMVRGEGVLGLPRAFLYAGARNVVVSLWSVSDEGTADLMTSFYREMIQKKRPAAEALARAKEDMMRSERWHHPFYWAGFVLIGPG